MIKYSIYFFLLISIILPACKDNPGKVPPNPFDEYKDSVVNGGQNPLPPLDPKSFAGMHQNIFKPTCANSGCHDGTFEPDFRTIESSYNTLVLRAVIKNNPQNSFQYRVKPGDPAASVLWERLNTDIDGQSGIMPLVVDPGSDWDTKKSQYLNDIRDWIQNGAKDMFGNSPVSGNLQPSMRGIIGFPAGNTTSPLDRDAGTGAILVPPGSASFDLWFSFADDNASPQDLQNNTVKFSASQNDFSGSPSQSLQIVSPVNQTGYFGDIVPYTHKVTVNMSAFANGSTIFARAYVKDPLLSNVTEIPAEGSAGYIKQYFSFKKQ
ncbi:MAG: hypothetical protein K1X92_12585 [Bacteroidia bacterium]|nr:hypothetical protein [Bacteroidia bacterium]